MPVYLLVVFVVFLYMCDTGNYGLFLILISPILLILFGFVFQTGSDKFRESIARVEEAERAERESRLRQEAKIQYEKERQIQQKLEEERRQQQKILEHENRQAYLLKECEEAVFEAKNKIDSLPLNLKRASNAITTAKNEFVERAFAPYWDAIEKATIELGKFNDSVWQIQHLAKKYSDHVSQLDSGRIPVLLDKNWCLIQDPSSVVRELEGVVRVAQKDYQFASIYEQRKTNKLLHDGFITLGQALSEMKYNIACSIESLSSITYEIGQDRSVDFADTISSLDDIARELKNEAIARREHERIAQEMLDNIQSRRTPS